MRSTAILVAAAALLAPAAADAQLRFIPQVGLYAPATDLPSLDEAIEIEKESTLAFGLAVEFGNADATSLRVNVLHATDSEVPVADVGCEEDCARSSLTAATAAVVLRPLPNLILVRPYLLAGAGLKRYDFSRDDLEDEGLRAVLNDQNQLTGHLGVGAEVGLGLVRLTAEVSDLISDFETDDVPENEQESKLQHDFFLTLGVVIGG